MDIPMEQLSPMMVHYLETKKQHEDCILFYRLGDFYEMFFEDAQLVSKELELTLTGKSCGLEERAPMCGVPFHAADTYITRLVENGHKVAICEQVEDPKLAKGMVKREVIRIVTPGTNTAPGSVDETKNNFLMCLIWQEDRFGIATVDVSTGDFYVTEVSDVRKVMDEITKFNPSEIVSNAAICMSGIDFDDIKNRLRTSVYTLGDWMYEGDNCEKVLREHFHLGNLFGLGLGDMEVGTISAGAVLNYLYDTQKIALSHITELHPYTTGKYMIIDSATRRNLELCETLREKQKRGSLLWVLDKTKTAMGARMLRLFTEQPLLDTEEIKKRQKAIAELNENMMTREEIREYLNAIYDLERLICRISYQSANPRDLIAFKSSLAMLPPIRFQLKEFKSKLIREEVENLDPLSDLHDLIEQAIDPDPPLTTKEGGIIRSGYNEEVDRLREAKTSGKQWLTELEERERNNTGIKNLKIKYNRVFGYYLEVTNSFKDLVPNEWIRKQTLTGAERFTTPELKELEDTIMNAEDKLFSLEYRLFVEVRERIFSEVNRIQRTAKAIAMIDAMASLAYVAERNHFVCPVVNGKGTISIKDGRHPVVEQMIPNQLFVANDTLLDNASNRVSVITGPNMAGKSTYMRQTALIVLMAQMGSFVPASAAEIGICDRIFTRVGASDDLASGQSTFMVEMTEVANILRNATKNSLLVLDEIGRGTSTYDGLAIAWAVIEHVANPHLIGAKTLFATHYHELTELEGKLEGVCNYCIAVKEQGDDIIFLRKIIRGGADKSYGIQVARLAGVPESVLARARDIVEELVANDLAEKAKNIRVVDTGAAKEKKEKSVKRVDDGQLSLFGLSDSDSHIVDEIRSADLTRMTPIDALNLLYRLQQDCK
ncbi:MAG: DNA mismatch repair protein MutS [Lachnospiraceae bacterium]|nr:DNA mismatch repair protein MutS [Lachnospiraceae bacterium]